VPEHTLSPSALAFDALAERFDERFGAWESVAAQRRAVRAALVGRFPPGARLLEIGGGTGEDAAWLQGEGRHVLLTDPSPTMVRLASAKLARTGAPTPIVAAAESLSLVAHDASVAAMLPMDGAFSNFAALNCVADLREVARPLARLVRPGGHLALVLFGTASLGEVVVQVARGDWRAAFRRMRHADVDARVGGKMFRVHYHSAADVSRAFAPWFGAMRRRGIGIFVPPSAAEPWISGRPRLLRVLEQLDRAAERPLAIFGDHVMYELTRTTVVGPSEAGERTP